MTLDWKLGGRAVGARLLCRRLAGQADWRFDPVCHSQRDRRGCGKP